VEDVLEARAGVRPRAGSPRAAASSHRTCASGTFGLRGWRLHVLSPSTVWLCVTLWTRAKTVDQDERGNAERRALIIGLWPPMLWLMGDTLERHE
jgi:hypothetical protein